MKTFVLSRSGRKRIKRKPKTTKRIKASWQCVGDDDRDRRVLCVKGWVAGWALQDSVTISHLSAETTYV